MHLKDLQEFIDFISAKFGEYKNKQKTKKREIKTKKGKKKKTKIKTCLLEKNLMDASNKILSQEQNIDKQKQLYRRNCVLVNDFPKNRQNILML